MKCRSKYSKSKISKVKRFSPKYVKIAEELNNLCLSKNASNILAYLHQIKSAETIDFENALFNKRRRYLFQWEKIPGEDSKKLLKFINERIHDVKGEKIEKFDNDKAIRINIEDFFIIIRLNNEKTIAELRKLENKSYLFSWEDVPGNDNGRFFKYLTEKCYSLNYNTDWIKAARIEKMAEGKTIRISSEKNYITIILNDDKTRANLKIDDGRTEEFITILENNKLKIYDESNKRVLKTFLVNSKKNELYIYNGERDRIIQPQISFALKELRERGWIDETEIKPDNDDELLFKRYKPKIGLDKIIPQLEDERKKKFDEAAIKIQQLRGNDYKEIVDALMYFCITKNRAKILAYLKNAKEATISELMNNTKINNSQLSVALKKIMEDKKRDLIAEREEKINGKGRPHKIYSLKGGYDDFVAELEKEQKKGFDNAQKDIGELRSLTKNRSIREGARNYQLFKKAGRCHYEL